MTLPSNDITVYRGARVTIPFALNPTGSVTGQTFTFTLAKQPNFATKLVEEPLTWDDESTGAGHVVLDATDTDLKPGTYYWDVWRTDDGFEQPFAIGTMHVVADVRCPESATASPADANAAVP
jgi:hypothetical protein